MIENKGVVLTLNPKIYSIETIYSAGYVFLDKAYFIIDGDPEKEIKLQMFAKEGNDIEKVKLDFYNELLNYASFNMKLEKNKEIARMIIEKALFSSNPKLLEEAEEKEIKELLAELEKEGGDEIKEIIKEIENDSKNKK